jgi:hypothetical protein
MEMRAEEKLRTFPPCGYAAWSVTASTMPRFQPHRSASRTAAETSLAAADVSLTRPGDAARRPTTVPDAPCGSSDRYRTSLGYNLVGVGLAAFVHHPLAPRLHVPASSLTVLLVAWTHLQ